MDQSYSIIACILAVILGINSINQYPSLLVNHILIVFKNLVNSIMLLVLYKS